MADGVGDVEQLVILLTAKVTDLDRQMAKANSIATTNFAAMRKASKTATAAMEADMMTSTRSINASLASTGIRIGEVGAEFAAVKLEGYSEQFLSLGKSILAPILALMTLEGAVEAVKAQVERADSSGKLADSLGLSVESLTQLEHAAQMADVPLDTLSTGLRTLANNCLKEAEGSSGTATKALKTLGVSVTDTSGKLKPTNQLFTEVAQKFAGMQNGAEKTGLAMQIFGRSGAALIPVLNQGRDGLKDMADESDRLGLTVSGKAASGAAELADQVKLLEDELQGMASIAVQATIPAMEGAVSSLTDLFGEAGSGGPILDLLEGGIKDVSAFIVQLTGAVQQCIDVFEGLNVAWSELNGGKGGAWQVEAWFDKAGRDGAAADKKAKSILDGTYVAPKSTDKPAGGTGDNSGSGIASSGGAGAAKKIDETTKSLNKQIAALTETGRQQAEQNALAEAGITINDKAAKGIIDLSDKLYDQKAALKAVNDGAQFFSQTMESAFEGLITGGQSVSDVLGDIGKAIADAVIQAELLGTGPLAWILGTAPATPGAPSGLLGTLLGGIMKSILPGHADGTANTGGTRGQPAGIVHGQEAVIPLPNGGRVPVQLSAPAASGSMPTPVFHLETNITNNSNAHVTEKNTATKGGLRKEIVIDNMVAGAIGRPNGASNQAVRGAGRLVKR